MSETTGDPSVLAPEAPAPEPPATPDTDANATAADAAEPGTMLFSANSIALARSASCSPTFRALAEICLA